MNASTLTILRVTLQVALCATIVAGVPAILCGRWLSRRTFVGKSAVDTLLALPLVLPPTAIGYLLLTLLSRDGWLGPRALGFDPDLLFTWKGAVIASATMAFPLMVRSARAAFDEVDPRLEKMGETLGLSRAEVFVRVTLPLARRGLCAALALGFGRALGEFGATVIVAGNIPGRTQTIALAIFEGIQLGDDDRALELVAIAAGLAFALLWLVERLQRRDPRERGARSA